MILPFLFFPRAEFFKQLVTVSSSLGGSTWTFAFILQWGPAILLQLPSVAIYRELGMRPQQN